jgi:hypothetical protein
MTGDLMNLRTLLEKTPDADLVREVIGFVDHRFMAKPSPSLSRGGTTAFRGQTCRSHAHLGRVSFDPEHLQI